MPELHKKSTINLAKVFVTAILATPLIPGFGALDTGATQWFYLSVLSTLGLILLHFSPINISFPATKSTRLFTGVVIIFCFWGYASTLWAYDKPEAIHGAAQLSITAILGFLIYAFAKACSEKLIAHMLYTIVIITLLIGGQVLWVFFQDISVPRSIKLIAGTRLNFGSINVTSAYFAYVLPVITYLILQNNKLKRVIAGITLTVTYLCILLIGSRTAILSALLITAGILIYGAVQLYRMPTSKRWVAMVFSVILTLSVALIIGLNINKVDKEANNLTSLYTSGNKVGKKAFGEDVTRLQFYKLALHDFRKHPLTGLGLENWKISDKSNYTTQQNRNSFLSPQNVHNDFLQVLAELGIFGFLGYISIILMLIIILIRETLQRDKKHLAFFLLASLGAYILDAILNFPMARPTTQAHFILLSGITVAMYMKEGKLKKNVSKSLVIIPLLVIAVVSTYFIKLRYTSFVGNKILLSDYKNKNLYGDDSLVLSYAYAQGVLPNFYNVGPDGRSNQSILANYAYNEGDYERALQHLDTAIADVPSRFSAHMHKAIIFRKDFKNLDSAVFYAKIGVAKTPGIKNNYTVLLPSLLEQKDTLAYIDYAQKYLEIYSDDTNEWRRLTLVQLAKTKDYKAAMTVLKNGLEANPSSSDLRKVSQILSNSVPIEIDQTSSRVNLMAGLAALKDRDYTTALTEFKIANAKNPNNAIVLENLGLAALNLKFYDDAIAYFTQALQYGTYPNGAMHFRRGLTYELKGDKQKAAADYRKSKNMGYPEAQKISDARLNPN